MDAELIKALADHITSERYAHAVYTSLAIAFDAGNWLGFEHWARAQAGEEAEHAGKFIDYLNDRNYPAELQALEAPGSFTGQSPAQMINAALELEQAVTGQINALYRQAVEKLDPATCEFLLWFVREQVKSERDLTILLGRITRAGANMAALEIIDRGLLED